MSAKDGRVLADAKATCAQKSSRSVEDSFASEDYARAEIESALEQVGRHIVTRLTEHGPLACELQADAR